MLILESTGPQWMVLDFLHLFLFLSFYSFLGHIHGKLLQAKQVRPGLMNVSGTTDSLGCGQSYIPWLFSIYPHPVQHLSGLSFMRAYVSLHWPLSQKKYSGTQAMLQSGHFLYATFSLYSNTMELLCRCLILSSFVVVVCWLVIVFLYYKLTCWIR